MYGTSVVSPMQSVLRISVRSANSSEEMKKMLQQAASKQCIQELL